MLKIKNTTTTAKTTTRRKTEKGKVRFLTSLAIIFRTNTCSVIYKNWEEVLAVIGNETQDTNWKAIVNVTPLMWLAKSFKVLLWY